MLQAFLQKHRRCISGYIIGFCRSFTQVATSEGIISGNLLNLWSKWLGKRTGSVVPFFRVPNYSPASGNESFWSQGFRKITSMLLPHSLFYLCLRGHVFTLPQSPRPWAVLKTGFGRSFLKGYLSQQKFQKDLDGLSGLFGFSYSVIPIGRIFPLCLLFD